MKISKLLERTGTVIIQAPDAHLLRSRLLREGMNVTELDGGRHGYLVSQHELSTEQFRDSVTDIAKELGGFIKFMATESTDFDVERVEFIPLPVTTG